MITMTDLESYSIFFPSVTASGDPTAQNDKWNDRWILQQFTATDVSIFSYTLYVQK